MCNVFVLLSAVNKHGPTNIFGLDTERFVSLRDVESNEQLGKRLKTVSRGKSSIQQTGACFNHNLYLFILLI